MSDVSGKTILSGIQPSGTLHLGNYLGALKQWAALQDNNTAYYCIVDLHAITVPYEAEGFHDRILDAAAMYIACGIDPEKSTMFIQSHVQAHTELAWLLGTLTPFGELSRMTQFKDKAAKQQAGTSLGLFAYPVLMAADILLYKPDFVPVGDDQTQHVELTRNIAEKFNKKFKETFSLPKAYVPETTARIMSLSDPSKKMSKSDDTKTYIALADMPEVIQKKIMSATTDTDPVFSFENSGPAVKNLLAIYQAVTDKQSSEIESEFSGKGYKEFKETLAEAVIEHLRPIREKYEELRKDDTELRILLGRGAQKASHAANATLRKVKDAMGLV